MKFYLKQNVFDAGLERIRFLFDEFEDVIVSFSGGKDSTIILNLALIVAEEKGRLPLKVMFIDQEAEWKTVIDYIRTIMSDKRVDPYWLQVPIRLFNATSTKEPWLYCWEEGAKWIREREPNSYKENIYGTDRFGEMFTAFCVTEFGNKKLCHISGVRCEESPGRQKGLTVHATYKWVTWGRVESKKHSHFAFYPIYDWSYRDVWKAIYDNNWSYCKLYDYMYQYGISPRNMRVSNVHHETAVGTLFYLQEVEAETWDKVVRRIPGINSAGQLQSDGFFYKPKELPYMFKDWREYRDYLLEHLITDKACRDKMGRQFASYDARYKEEVQDELLQLELGMIFTNDYHGTKLANFRAAHGQDRKVQVVKENAYRAGAE